MAAALFRALIEKTLPDGHCWRVESAGTWAEDGQPVSAGSLEVMRQRGMDLSQHRSRRVTRQLIGQFDLVLTMEPGHKEALRLEFPEYADRIYLLSEMLGLSVPVRDPYGEALIAYEVAAETIENMLCKGLNRIIAMVEARRVKI